MNPGARNLSITLFGWTKNPLKGLWPAYHHPSGRLEARQ